MLGHELNAGTELDPISLAKEIASVDQISNGRFLFGVGGGWNEEELANHYDFPWKRRWKVMRERIEASGLLPDVMVASIALDANGAHLHGFDGAVPREELVVAVDEHAWPAAAARSRG